MPERHGRALLRLRPGVRVSRRGHGQLQVGFHPDQRAVLSDVEHVRVLLRGLGHGIDPDRLEPEAGHVLTVLVEHGLVVPADAEQVRRRVRAAAGVAVVAPGSVSACAVRAISAAGLGCGAVADPVATVVVTLGAEPRRDLLDQQMRADRAHLPVTLLAGRVRIGPLVVPGITACVRCLDEHEADRDPRHALVLEQHHDLGTSEGLVDEDLQLGLAWAARDLAGWVDGRRPVTWSSTVELGEGEPPSTRRWARHPRCGCAWGDVS